MNTKNAIILHGTGDSPEDYWFPYIKSNLESRGFSVWAPALPNAAKPNLQDWLPFVLENGEITENTILIGHSAGAQLILSILENIDCRVKQAILVSGYARALVKTEHDKENNELDWNKAKEHAQNIIFVNSDNDPWECDDKQGRIMFDHLGGTQIIRHGEGHMGSGTFKQPYKEFPFLASLISD